MAHIAITIEGGLISGDLLERIAATPQAVDGQRPTDFGVEGRLSEEIQSAFSDAGAYWTALRARLHRAKESTTTVTRETWVLPLLEELGYNLRFQRAALQAGGNSYAISHRLGDDATGPPIHIVGSDQELEKRGEAKQSPHALVQDYLNRSDALWGIVTNGIRLRLLRDTTRFSKPSYIEFDLEAMLDGGLYSEFVLFYRLIHVSRLPRGAGDAHECFLERYHQQGIEEGGRVREKLRDGVKDALEILGTAFLAHPDSANFRDKFAAKHLADIDYYRQLLRLIYRLLFLMVAEERRLLFVPSLEVAARQEIYIRWYSIARLRERADARLFDDSESDLWQGLKQTFRLFENAKTASELGLTALDGELFGRFACADLIDTRTSPGPHLFNDKLLLAIWHLSTFEDVGGKKKRGHRRRVNFAGLDVEELGSVYEALLEYHPQVTIEGERSKFELVEGSERKSTGSYYTPPELVRELVKSALEPVLEDRLAKVSTKDQKERALLSLKVCDPASGSGHFILAAARRIGRELARIRSDEADPNPQDYRRAIRDVIRHCIYATDKNPLAVDLCKVALWIEGHAIGLPLSFLDNHVKNGDSLVGVLDLGVLEAGIPDGAFGATKGDDRKVASGIRKRNNAEAKEVSLFRHNIKGEIEKIAGAFAAVAELPENTPDEVHAKEAAYASLCDGAEWLRVKAACDLWTAAFFAPLSADEQTAVPTTRNVWDAILGHRPQGRIAGLMTVLSNELLFFHWPLEFPEVFAQGGFDVMLGNPPWDVVQLSDEEFFAARIPAVAALKGVKRKRAIAALEHSDPALWKLYCEESQVIENLNDFIRGSGRYKLASVGKANTASLFVETYLDLSALQGRAGLITPAGILSDDTSKLLFQAITLNHRLVSAISFENEEFIFPGIANVVRFTLLTLLGAGKKEMNAELAFYIRKIEQIQERERFFQLTSTEFQLFNPNSLTCPIFRTRADATLTKKIYLEVPVLVKDDDAEQINPWNVLIQQNCFSHTTDGDWFLSGEEIRRLGGSPSLGNWQAEDGRVWLPLYEAKLSLRIVSSLRQSKGAWRARIASCHRTGT
ncbi:MAG TPA: N-6 DNA methylase [Rhizomicrobium sp.]|jgi:hypothetical protein|nr:N-6 DNA methylase [Rhizomicrobium sp.]